MKKVQIGDTVTVNYVGKLEDGSVFDTSLQEGREPLTSVLGKNQLIPGFENGLIDMVIGDKKTKREPMIYLIHFISIFNFFTNPNLISKFPTELVLDNELLFDSVYTFPRNNYLI